MMMRRLHHLGAVAVRVWRAVDGRDVHVYGGLVLVVAGLWALVGAASVAVAGAVLLYLGVWRMR